MKRISTFGWEFGGGLHAGWSSWLVLAIAGVAGIALLAFFYTRTLRALPAGPRRTLTAFRVVFWTLLLLFLANPVHRERTTLEAESKQPLAVVLDRSASMTARDNRGQSRLEDAARRWPQLEAAAKNLFSRVDFFSFGTALQRAPSFAEAKEQRNADDQTRLFQSVAEVLQQSPAGGFKGIVCFTDGLDTTEQPPAGLVEAALTQRTPLYFVPSQNRLRPAPFLSIRETSAPPQVRRRSQFDWRSVIETYSPVAQRIPVSLWQGEKKIAESSLDLPAGRSVVPWSSRVTADEAGVISYEMRVGEGEAQQFSNVTIRVVDKTAVSILYYQGALDWGFPFLANILRRDPSFKLTSIFNPSINLQTPASQAANDLPTTAAELDKHQLIILANPFANKLTPAQQDGLVDYTRRGGGILFITPDAAASQAFAGTKIEEILPVVFEPPKTGAPKKTGAERFEELMRSQRGAAIQPMDFSGTTVAEGPEVPPTPLKPFVLTAAAQRLPIFASAAGQKPVLPKFETSVSVKGAKAGAEVLAVNSAQEKRVLLATQFFGKGITAVLTSDPLWRWKLSLPSEAREAETFWQQLLLWLARGPLKGIYFDQSGSEFALNKAALLKLAGGESPQPPGVKATSPSGKQKVLPVEASEGPGEWVAKWQPDESGVWQMEASEAGKTASAKMHVQANLRTRESSNLPPDLEALRHLAEATGGELILGDVPAAWRATVTEEPALISERSEPVWNSWLLLGLALGVYATELTYRRTLKLL